MLPHYYWFYFDDEAIIKILGDSLGFKDIAGWLEPVVFYDKYAELISAIHEGLTEYLKQQHI